MTDPSPATRIPLGKMKTHPFFTQMYAPSPSPHYRLKLNKILNRDWNAVQLLLYTRKSTSPLSIARVDVCIASYVPTRRPKTKPLPACPITAIRCAPATPKVKVCAPPTPRASPKAPSIVRQAPKPPPGLQRQVSSSQQQGIQRKQCQPTVRQKRANAKPVDFQATELVRVRARVIPIREFSPSGNARYCADCVEANHEGKI